MKERSNFLKKFLATNDISKSLLLMLEQRRALWYFLIVLMYTVLTIILTYPVAFTIGTEVPGGWDAFQWMTTFWYTNFAIFHPDVTTLTYSSLNFYPAGIPVTPFSSAFNQVITLILLPIFQIQVIYSILWLVSFILAAFGTFLLVRYLTKNDYAAFISGIIFAFAPYHMAHGLGHMGATTIQWIPFCAFFFMKVFREGGLKNCILAGIFYILVAMSDLQYMIFMGIFIGILFVYEHYTSLQVNGGFKSEAHKSILIKYLIIGLVAFSVILPLTITDIQVASSGNNFLKPDPKEAITYSTDLLSFFLPSTIHPLFGGIVTPVYQNFAAHDTGHTEHTTYIGYTVLILSIIAVFIRWKDLTVRFWGITAVLFSLFSLGPILHINGTTVFTVFRTTVPLPHIILYYMVPFVENCRATGRFFIVAALAFSVLAGYGCSELIKRYDVKKIIIVTLLCALIIFEFLSIPYHVTPVDHPSFYQKIGQDPERYGLLEIPMTMNYDAGVKIQYYQTIHGKPLVGGHAARIPIDARNFEKDTPFIREMTYFNKQQATQDILNQNNSVNIIATLNYYNIRYIILHKEFLTETDMDYIQNSLPSPINKSTPVYNDETMIVYEVPKGEENLYMSLLPGWSNNENWSGISTRWIQDNATLRIYSENNQLVSIHFQAVGFHIPRTLEIYSGDQLLSRTGIPTYTIPVNVTIPLKTGKNDIRFNMSEKAERPIDIPELNSDDSRSLGIAIQNVTVSHTTDTWYYGSNWDSDEIWSGTHTRWMSDNATLLIEGLQDQWISLHFRAISFNILRMLEIYSGNTLLSNVSIQTSFVPVNVTLPLNMGTTEILFRMPDGAQKPSEIPGMNSSDNRSLSIALQNITYSYLTDTWYYGSNWENEENWSGTATRWMSDNASLVMFSGEKYNTTLSMRCYTFYNPKMMGITTNNLTTEFVNVPPGFIDVNVPVTLKRGKNIIRFSVPDSCHRPDSIPKLNSTDTRCLSVAMQNITFSTP